MREVVPCGGTVTDDHAMLNQAVERHFEGKGRLSKAHSRLLRNTACSRLVRNKRA